MANNQIGRRRAPQPVPALSSIATAALQDSELPDAAKEQLRNLFKRLELYLKSINVSTYTGLPTPHASTHASGESDQFLHGSQHNPDAVDAISTAAPSGDQFAEDAGEGTESTLARSDHIHSRPRADQVQSSYSFSSIEQDIQWAATAPPWVKVYAHSNFK